MDSVSKESVKKLTVEKDNIENELVEITKMREEKMWLNELGELKKAYNDFINSDKPKITIKKSKK
tara:strand:- start:988 stop:1182 length:195 start_codon:yes stop_codon:yes gene_type:complete